jgi:hypothetical protein
VNHLIFQNGSAEVFFSELLKSELETAAILFARPVVVSEGRYRLLVAEVHYVPDEAYGRRTGDSIELRPEFLASVIKSARNRSFQYFLSIRIHGLEILSRREQIFMVNKSFFQLFSGACLMFHMAD